MVSILEGTIKKVWGFNATLYKDIEFRKCTSILLKSILGGAHNDFLTKVLRYTSKVAYNYTFKVSRTLLKKPQIVICPA
jgi:hypothetical protein